MSEVGDRNFAQIVPEPEVFQKTAARLRRNGYQFMAAHL